MGMSDWEIRQLDIKTGLEMDRRAETKRKQLEVSIDKEISLTELQAIGTVLNAAVEYWATHTSKRELKIACQLVGLLLERQRIPLGENS